LIPRNAALIGLLGSYVLVASSQIISFGRFQLPALALVLLACVAGMFPAVLAVAPGRDPAPARLRLVLVVLSAAMIAVAFDHNPLTYTTEPSWPIKYRTALGALLALAATYSLPGAGPGWLRRPRALLVLAILIWTRLAVPLTSPIPGEDVWVVQQEAAAAVLAGIDPYSVEYTQIFAPEVYEVLGYRSGFHYPPLTLLAVVPPYALFHDVRWAYVCFELLVLWFLWSSTSRRTADRSIPELIVLLWGLNTSVLFVLEHGWTEPLGAALIAGFVALSERRRNRLAAVCLGAFFSFKQYTILLFPLILFLPHYLPVFIAFVLINTLSYVPWLLWNREGLVANLVEPWRAPPRADALSLSAYWMFARRAAMPDWINPLCLLAGMNLALTRIERGVAGLVFGIFLVLALFFLTAKQSFCNYYYLLSFLMLVCAIFMIHSPSDTAPTAETPESSTTASGCS